MYQVLIGITILISFGIFYLVLIFNRNINMKKHYKELKGNQYITGWWTGSWGIFGKRSQVAHGPYKKFYSSGKIKETGEYKYGEEMGVITEYYRNGSIKQSRDTYDGGICIEYYKSGRIKKKTKMRFTD